MPVITAAPGFRGYCAVSDGRDASRAVSVTLFDTREHAMAAQEKAVAAVRDHRIAPDPPSVMAGRTVAVAAVEG